MPGLYSLPPQHTFFFFFSFYCQHSKPNCHSSIKGNFPGCWHTAKGQSRVARHLIISGCGTVSAAGPPPAFCASFGSYNDSGQVASLLWASSAPWMVCLDISSSGWKVWIWAFFLSFTKAVSNGLQLNWYQIHCNEGQRHWDPAPVAVGFHYRCP